MDIAITLPPEIAYIALAGMGLWGIGKVLTLYKWYLKRELEKKFNDLDLWHIREIEDYDKADTAPEVISMVLKNSKDYDLIEKLNLERSIISCMYTWHSKQMEKNHPLGWPYKIVKKNKK